MIKKKVMKIIENLTSLDNIDDNIDLLDSDILDSLAFVELIGALEDEFDIEIQPTQIPPDTWRKVDSISKLVESLISKES